MQHSSLFMILLTVSGMALTNAVTFCHDHLHGHVSESPSLLELSNAHMNIGAILAGHSSAGRHVRLPLGYHERTVVSPGEESLLSAVSSGELESIATPCLTLMFFLEDLFILCV